jgi:hypothetical protein
MRHARGATAGARAGCGNAVALCVAVACCALARPAAAQTVVTCSNSAWTYVAGFTGITSVLNGYYAPYYDASQAPSPLRACSNVAYGNGTGSVFAANFNTSWQSAGHPVGYYNTRSTVSDPTNSFWVRQRRVRQRQSAVRTFADPDASMHRRFATLTTP